MKESLIFEIFLFVVILLLGSIASISYLADPGGLFKGDPYYREMADILLSGHMVTNASPNFDWGKFRSNLINQNTLHEDVIVLGSSRMLEINASILGSIINKNERFLNLAIPGGNLGDQTALLNLLLKKEMFPKKIVIGLDPWILNSNASAKEVQLLRYPSLTDSFEEAKNRFGYSPLHYNVSSFSSIEFEKYSELISKPYFVASLTQIFLGIDTHPDITSDQYSEKSTFLPDGSITQGRNYRDTLASDIDKEVKSISLLEYIPLCDNFVMLDPERISLFKSYIDYLQKNKVELYFYLSPQHPIIYKEILSDKKYLMVLEEEKFFREYAKNHNILIYGSYDPRPWNLSSADYYDSSHIRSNIISRIFASGPVLVD
jgi:hypothetical protein